MIQVVINGTDRTSQLVTDSLDVQQILGAQRDTAKFSYRKYGSKSYIPAVLDTVVVYDGASKIFGGRIVRISEKFLNGADGLVYTMDCADYSFDMDSLLVSQSYSSMTVNAIIADILTNYGVGFTGTNVDCAITIGKVVLNQVPISQCLKRLADMVKYDWYVDPDKDVHFFSKYINTAPFNLTDTSGNYIVNSLERKIDGSQIANQVKVRGGEYEASTFTSAITIKGSSTKTVTLPYKFSNLTVTKNAVGQTIGIDFIDDPATKDLLYNYNDATLKFPAVLADGDVISFTGNPKVRVLAVASDAASIATYGIKEKIIEDTSIEDLSTARKRAIGELSAFKDQQNEARFDTYTAGLRAGMVMNLNSSRRSTNVDFIVRSVRFKPFKPDTYAYNVELVTTKKYDLTELLQSILQPSNLKSGESETVETIKTDIATVTIAESITGSTATPYADTITITFTENIQKDPLGAGVEPTWVLGDYFPSGPTDTKRVGLLDRSLKFY